LSFEISSNLTFLAIRMVLTPSLIKQ